MNWFNWIEERKRLLVGGMSAICGLALFVCARRNPVSFDSFWHLRMGMDWVQKGLNPWVDHYSFTFPNADIQPVPVLFQAALYWFVAQFGEEPGYQLLKFAFFSLTFGLLIAHLKQLKAPAFVFCIVLPLLVALIELRAMVRPELLSYALIMAAMMLYRLADYRVSMRSVIPIVLLMCFWSNYHSPVFGYVIFFGFFIDAGVRLLRQKASVSTWLRWLAWGILVVGVGAINPGWSHPLYDQLQFDPKWTSLIQEYKSPLLYKGVAAIYALIIVGLVSLWLSIRQRRFGYIAIIFILAYVASTMARLVTPAGIVLICIFSHVVTQSDLRSWLYRMPNLWRRASGVLVFVLVALSLWTTVSFARAFMQENKRLVRLFPSDVVMHMKQNAMAGNIFNDYQIGGYLLYRLAPESRVYIDGRTNILYPIDHFLRYQSAQFSPDVFDDEVEKYGIDYAVLENLSSKYWLMYEARGFGLDFVGASYSLFTQQNPKFPIFGMLLARPSCWRESLIPGLKSEEISAQLHLLGDSALWPFLELVMNYSVAANRPLYIKNLDTRRNWDDNSLRFVAYRAIEHGEFDLAVSLMAATVQKEPKDLLATAWALLRMGKLDQAQQALRIASLTNWTHLELVDFAIMNELISRLEDSRDKTTLDEHFVSLVRDRLQASGLVGRRFDIKSSLFCADDGWRETH